MPSNKLFLSYSRADGESVRAIGDLLEARGVATFLDRDDLAAGQPWPQALESALATASAAAVFVGPHGFGKWQKREMYFALDRQARSDGTASPFPVIPVLLPGADAKSGFLFLNTWVDLRQDIRDPEGLAALERAAGGNATGPASDRETRTLCPYRGLRAFEEEDAPFFFGREALSRKLLEAVLEKRFVAVVGPSGSGKSSVVKAGLVPLLRRRRPPEPTWQVVSFRPGDRPFHRLAAALVPDLDPELGETDRLLEVEKLGDGLERGEIRLSDVVDRLLLKSEGTDRLLLVVDQFEELFTLTPAESTRHDLVERLLAAVDSAPVRVLLTFRADFYGHALRLDHDLSDRLERAQVNVGPMREDELRRAIEEPARLVGLELESGLADRILDDVADEPGSLPLLEFALTELWERRRDGRITHAAYDEIGEVAGAIARRAEAEVQRFSDDELRAARTLFTALVRVARPEEGAEDTRRRAVVAHLGSAERAVLDELASPGVRLLVTGRDEGTGEKTAEVAHEALIRTWPRLRRWLDEDREFLLWRQRLRLGLAEWQRTGRDPGTLLRGVPLAEAERWLTEREAELGEEERHYVEASVELREALQRSEERRRRTRKLLTSAALVVLLVVATVIGLLWVRADRRADEVRASSIVMSAEAAEDPLVGVLLLGRLDEDLHGGTPPDRWIGLARRLVEAPVPTTILRGPSEAVTGASYSPDGSRIATAFADGTVRIWNADGTGRPLVLDGHSGEIAAVAFSPDGSKILTASPDDGTVRVRQADGTGEPAVLELTRHPHGVASFSPDGSQVVSAFYTRYTRGVATSLGPEYRGFGSFEQPEAAEPDEPSERTDHYSGIARSWRPGGTGNPEPLDGEDYAVLDAAFSPDGSKIAAACSDGAVRVRRADGTGELVVLEGHEDAVTSVAFSRDGSRILSGSSDGTARLWNADGTGEPLVFRSHDGPVTHVTFDPGGSKIATGCADGVARVFRPDAPNPLVSTPLEHHEWGQDVEDVTSVAFDPTGSRVLTTSSDGTARVWQAEGDGEPVAMQGHGSTVTSAAFSPDGSRVVTAGSDGNTRVWRATGGGASVVLPGVRTATFSPDGSKIVTAMEDTALVWHADGTGEPTVLGGHEDDVTGVAFSPDGSGIVTSTWDGTARVWAADGSGEPAIIQGEPALSLAISPDGSKIVTAGGPFAVVLQADGTGSPVLLEGHDSAVMSAAFSPDGSRIVTSSWDGTARVWAADGTGEPLVLTEPSLLASAAFSPDGSKIVTASYDYAARIWPADGGSDPLVFRGHRDRLNSAAFSPDGSKIVTASNDETARVWQADGSGEPLEFQGNAPMSSAAFSPDGSKIVTTSSDGTARIWPVGWSALIEHIRNHTTACLTPAQRRRFLDEAPGVARSRFQECERRHGREPSS